MIYLWISLILFCLLIGYLLFAPFYIEIDTEHSVCRFRFHKLMSISFLVDGDPDSGEFQLMFWKKRFSLKSVGLEKEEKSKAKNVKDKVSFSIDKILNVIKSFKVNYFYLTIDTGNMPLNGILYPLVYLLGVKIKQEVSINFIGRNVLKLQIENSLARVSRAYFARI